MIITCATRLFEKMSNISNGECFIYLISTHQDVREQLYMKIKKSDEDSKVNECNAVRLCDGTLECIDNNSLVIRVSEELFYEIPSDGDE